MLNNIWVKMLLDFVAAIRVSVAFVVVVVAAAVVVVAAAAAELL